MHRSLLLTSPNFLKTNKPTLSTPRPVFVGLTDWGDFNGFEELPHSCERMQPNGKVRGSLQCEAGKMEYRR